MQVIDYGDDWTLNTKSLLKRFFHKTLDETLDAWLPALKTAVETQTRS